MVETRHFEIIRGGIILTKDIAYLKDYKKQVSVNLAKQFNISEDEADKILQILETEDFIRIEAPKYQEKQVTVLTHNKSFIKDKLGMTSQKMGNIILNTYLDWSRLAKMILASISTVASFDRQSPFLICVGMLSVILSASELTDVKISENGTAIIMALQQHKKHKMYRTEVAACRDEANEILLNHGYQEMDDRTFQNELTKLIEYRCVDVQEGMAQLREMVVGHY